MKIPLSTGNTKEFEKVRIPEGMHVAMLKEVKEVSEGKYGDRLAFIYNIPGQNDTELALICYNNNPASPDNKLGQTLMAHGVDVMNIAEPLEADTDNLPHNTINAWVEDYTDEGGKVGSIVTKVKPLSESIPSVQAKI